MPLRQVFALLIACLALVVSRPARADLESARAKFSEGVKRLQRGDYDEARRLFIEADREHPSPVIAYNLALAEEHLGHPQAAVDAYERYLATAEDNAEFEQAAALAVAQIKARSGRLRIDSEPAGLHVTVNGHPERELTPSTVLVPPGHHFVVVDAEDFRESVEVDVEAGQTKPLLLTRPNPQRPFDTLDGLMVGAAIQVTPYWFLPRNGPSESGAFSVVVGLSADVSYAFSDHAAFGLRAFGSVGTECTHVFDSHVAAIGPQIQLRLAHSWWLGLGLYGGNGATCRQAETGTKKFDTDIVFSPAFDVSYAVSSQKNGAWYSQWVVSAGLGFFFATPSNDNRLFYAPTGFGPRFF